MDEEGISMQEFKEAFEKGNLFASGIGKSFMAITAASTAQHRCFMAMTHSQEV